MLEHPLVVPVTVYVVVVVGETVAVAAVPAPLFHEYVVAPDAEIVVDCPEQMVDVPVAVTVGVGLTVIVTDAVFVHPAVVPVTVYVVVDVGDTEAVAEVPAPLFQEYVVAPDAEIDVGCPAQMVAVPVAATVGNGLTVTVIGADAAEHPDPFV